MMCWQRCVIGLLAILLLDSCGDTASKHSFCYWQRNFHLSTADKHILQQTGVNHLYIRYFDVNWDEEHQQSLPVGTLIVSSPIPCKFTPSVFITNKVFENVSHAAIDSLAARVVRRVAMINRQFLSQAIKDSIGGNRQSTTIARNWTEILFDCDWTVATRDRYFYFLQKMEEYYPKKRRTTTLRLWQFKHRDISGIPPVNNCLLMCYNLTDPKKATTTNSIGSTKELTDYLTRSNYPHHLDIALPIFSWGVVFHHSKWLGLISNVEACQLRKDIIHFKEVRHNRFMLTTDTVIGKRYLRYGDEIRMEEINTSELENMVDIIKKRVSLRSSSRLTLFSLDPHYVNRYGMEEIRRLYMLFDR